MKRILRRILLLTLCCALLAACCLTFAAGTQTVGTRWLSGIAADGRDLLVTDTFNKTVWRVRGGEFLPFAGCSSIRDDTGAAEPACLDGSLTEARFAEPWAIAPFLNGWAVTDAAANVVRCVSEDGVKTCAGSGRESTLNYPTGLAADADGGLYIADTGNGAIRRLDKNGELKTVCTGLNRPTGLCWHNGTLYVAETGAQRIVKLTDGAITVIAGSAEDGEGGYVNGKTENALFRNPQGIAVAKDGTIYVADTDNSAVRRIRGGTVTTVADRTGMLTSPRALVLSGSTLLCTDTFSGSLFSFSLAAPGYADVKSGDWFASDVRTVTEYGLLEGTERGYEPQTELTRAMFVTILSRVQTFLDGDTVIDGDSQFSDVPDTGWYSAPARWAADAGIVEGVSRGVFAGSVSIQRQQLVTMLYRFAKANGLSTSARADLKAYADKGAVQSYARDAMRWAVGAGILDGLTADTLAPAAPATRAQTAAILIRFLAACGV